MHFVREQAESGQAPRRVEVPPFFPPEHQARSARALAANGLQRGVSVQAELACTRSHRYQPVYVAAVTYWSEIAYPDGRKLGAPAGQSL